MSNARDELVKYGVKIVQSGLVAGAGGNISCREGNTVWMKPSGFAMDEISADDLCGIELATGRQQKGIHKPTSEINMHLGIYRVRPDIKAVFHTHSPWASGVISAGVELKPMFAEFVNDLGQVGSIPYTTPTTQKLANAVAASAKDSDTLFLANHGIVALGITMKQAYFRCLVVEDAAKSMVAAAVVGKPQFLNQQQIEELESLDTAKHRVNVMEHKRS